MNETEGPADGTGSCQLGRLVAQSDESVWRDWETLVRFAASVLVTRKNKAATPLWKVDELGRQCDLLYFFSFTLSSPSRLTITYRPTCLSFPPTRRRTSPSSCGEHPINKESAVVGSKQLDD